MYICDFNDTRKAAVLTRRSRILCSFSLSAAYCLSMRAARSCQERRLLLVG